jgi:hypothetical protein
MTAPDTAPLSAEKLDEIEALAKDLRARRHYKSVDRRMVSAPDMQSVKIADALDGLLAMARSRPAAEVTASRNEVLEEAAKAVGGISAARGSIECSFYVASALDEAEAAIRALKSPGQRGRE